MGKKMFVLTALLALSAFGYAASTLMSDVVTARLGHYTFEIPKKYAQEGSSFPTWLTNLDGLDDSSRSIMLDFPAEELAKAVPGYQAQDGGYVEVVRAILNVLEPYEIARFENPNRPRELWKKIISEKADFLEQYRNTKWFKVSRKGDRYHGVVVKRVPENSDEFPSNPHDFWVATCNVYHSTITESGNAESCLTYAFYEDIAIEFYISGKNLHLIDEVRAYLRTRTVSWKVKQ